MPYRRASKDMNSFQHAYLSALRHIYDTEMQISVSLSAIDSSCLAPGLAELSRQIERQSRRQLQRLGDIFRVLYLEPRGQASWAATALLREAWEAAGIVGGTVSTEGYAAALLALKRYELSLYEALFRWSVSCALDEALPCLRKCIAEELIHAAALSEFAFESVELEPLPGLDRAALH